MGTLLQLKTSSLDLRKNVYRESIKEITPLLQLTFALYDFYNEPNFPDGIAPGRWNPIFLHTVYGIFDPYMVGSEIMNGVYNSHKSDVYGRWYRSNGIKRTRIFLNLVKKRVQECSYHIDFSIPQRNIKLGDHVFSTGYEEYIMSKHFICTREMITHKTIIIGFYHLATGTFKRYLIKDVKKLCKLLRVFNGDFIRLLGESNRKSDIYKQYNVNITKDEFDKRVLQLVSDASSIPVTNEHILEMLKVLREFSSNVSSVVNI